MNRTVIAALVLVFAGPGCGPPTAGSLIDKAEAEPTPENLKTADALLDKADLASTDRDRLFKLLAAKAAAGPDLAKLVNRYLDHSDPDRLGAAFDVVQGRWEELFAKSVPAELDLNRFLPLLADPDHGAKTAEFIGAHSSFPTLTASKLFEMVFDNATRKEALAGLVAIPSVKDWSSTDKAKKEIAAAVAKAGPEQVKLTLTGMASVDPLPPSVASIGQGLIDHLADKGMLKDYPPEALAMMIRLLLGASPEAGPAAATTLVRLLGAATPAGRKLATGLTGEAVRAKSPIAIAAATVILKSSDKADLDTADEILKMAKDAAAPAVVDAVVHAPAMRPARTEALLEKLHAWKVAETTGLAEFRLVNADGDARADVETKICRVVTPVGPPPDMDEGDEDDDKPVKLGKPGPEPKVDGCSKSEKSGKDGMVKFPGSDIGVWYVVNKSPGRKWYTAVNMTPDGKDMEPAWRCELTPKVGCRLEVVVE